jgi:hypothetical protein
VIGFEEGKDGSFTPASPRPANLVAWSQDAIQSIIAKYIDPTIQCMVTHMTARGSRDRYPIIVVPGGHRVPIRAKTGSPDGRRLVPHRVYIRRPGPASEEPQTAAEWDRLLERCLQNRKTELLEAMRSIMAGVVPTAPHEVESRLGQLLEFEKAAIGRWEASKRIAGLLGALLESANITQDRPRAILALRTMSDSPAALFPKGISCEYLHHHTRSIFASATPLPTLVLSC